VGTGVAVGAAGSQAAARAIRTIGIMLLARSLNTVFSLLARNHFSDKSPLHTRAGGGQMQAVLGGKANLDYVKPHSFAFGLPA
jgi:hypothetical protein